MRRSLRTIAAFAALAFQFPSLQAALDVSPADGLADIWAYVHGIGNVAPGGDEDGDGESNADEAIAGTNPRNPGSVIRIKSFSKNGGNVTLVFPAIASKRYDIQSSSTPANSGFAAVVPASVHTPGVDGDITVTIPAGSKTFFRVVVSDRDTDGDGLSDYEERMVGLLPNDPDSNDDGTSDFAYVSAQLALPDTVTVRAVESFASEDGQAAGQFEVSRSRSLFSVTIPYAVSGTASPAGDYIALPGSVSLAQGVHSAAISVNPTVEAPNVVESGESVTVTLLPPAPDLSGAYSIGDPGTATVIIGETAAATGTGLLARYYDTASGIHEHAANFGQASTYTYTRLSSGNPNTGIIVVPFAYTGTPALQVGHVVRLTFLTGNLNAAAYNHQDYTISGINPGVNFTAAISAPALPASGNGSCNFSIQSFPHPAVIQRVDPMVNFEWMGGTPNGNTYSPSSSPENYSTWWEGYLNPTTATGYRFQIDADDKARLLIDLDRNGTFDLPGEQVVEHGWDSAATVGTFKISGTHNLVIPTIPGERYKIRVEHVETTNEARCRLQWSINGAAFANIPTANVFSHVSAMSANYTYTRSGDPTVGTISVTVNGHPFAINDSVQLYFSSGNLFTPNTFNGLYTITATTATTFTVDISAPGGLPNSGTGAGFVGNSASTSNAWLNHIYANTTFAGSPGRVNVDATGPVTSNNGLYSTGTPDPSLIGVDTFSVRWTGQVQPQYSEEYTFAVHADDGCKLWINGQLQDLKTATSTTQTGTYTVDGTTGEVVVTYSNTVVKPSAYTVGELVAVDPTTGNLSHATGSTYTYNDVTGDAEVTYSNLTGVNPGGFIIGETVRLDPTSGTLTTLATLPYVVTAVTPTTFTVNFGTGVFAAGAGTINIGDTRDAVITAATSTSFSFNIGPGKYISSSGNMNFDVINKSLKDFSSMGNERYVRIPMLGGVRYNIQLDYYENAGFSRCLLYWFSPSQPRQIIPSNRLYPDSTAGVIQAPPILTSSNEALALVGGAFSYALGGSNGSTVSISGNPAWLTLSGGVLSGTPPAGAAGLYQIVVTTTGPNGTGTSVVNLEVQETGGNVTREWWTGVAGTSVANIPTGTAPTGSGSLPALEAPTDFGDNYGARIRGYLTAPLTGNYYFWVAGNNAAELWISNDDEPVNAYRRARVLAGSSTPQQWSVEPGQKSPWLALEAGKKYYIEILHKAGAGAGDNLAIGWLKPGQSGNTPSEVVPGYVLSPYVAPAPGANPGTLYVATMLAQGGAETDGVGTATLRLSPDENFAYVKFDHVGFETAPYNGMTGEMTDWHVHSDPFLAHPSAIIFDGVEPVTPGDGLITNPNDPNFGAFRWTIEAVAPLTKANIIELLNQGKAYINLHTALYPAGEIRGNFTLANGSRTFTPPPPAQGWTDDGNTNSGAARFLTQATFGPNTADIGALKAIVPAGGKTRYELWIEDQFAKPASHTLAEVNRTEGASAQGGAFDETLLFNAWWRNSVSGDDQLRQRIAFALSEIHVVSAQGPLDNNARSLAFFYDMLADYAFGNFRDLLEQTTLTWTMGRYLDMFRNDKPDLSTGRIPNENYAREIKQLFSVGLFDLWPDGTLKLNSRDELIPTYTQREIVGFAHVFTGWEYGYDGPFRTAFNAAADVARNMREVPARHFTGPKRILNNEVLPGLSAQGGQVLDPYATHNSAQFNDPAYQNLPAQELDAAHDQLFNHPNVGPFICRQLIQRLVTSHPSRDYLYRVAQKFNDNGAGVRGDMKAVIKAILLDFEARNASETAKPAYGKQREPVLRVAAAARAFRPNAFNGTYVQNSTSGRTITINTTTPHRLASGNNVFLDFTSGSPAPFIGIYSASVTGANSFTVQANGWATGTYSIPANSTVCTISMGSHWLEAGQKAYFDFTNATAGTTLNGLAGVDNTVHTAVTSNSVGTAPGTSFTISITGTTGSLRTGNVMIPRFTPGSYTTGASGLPAPQERRVTMDTNFDHHLNVGDQVQINFFGGNPLPTDMVVTVESVVDLNTWTFLATATGTNLGPNQGNNSVYQFPLVSQPLTRNGNVGSRPSTFAMGNTDGDMDQSPLNSPTVFNFYLPDYKFPGSLAAQGITTPEFQETAETSVIRQANFLERGIYTLTNTNGLSSFRSGSNALVMDLGQWMGNAVNTAGTVGAVLGMGPQPTQAWTSNANLPTLVDRLNTLLLGNALPAAAKQEILNLVGHRSIASISVGNPCTVTTTAPHGYGAIGTTETVAITGVTGGTFIPGINNTLTATITGASTFTVPVSCVTAGNTTNAVYSVVSYNNASPSDTNKRDRLRLILQLLLTSPDFTIQR